LLLLFAAGSLPLWAADPGKDELEHNTRLLEKWRADPQHYTRLQHDLQVFYALPRDRQEKLRRLDRELHECDSQTQKRLWETLERYVNWLDSLPEDERRQILGIMDKQDRLAAVRQKHEEQWLERLPVRDRERLKHLSEADRSAEIARLHEEDHQRRAKFLQALKHHQRPAALSDFPFEVSEFVEKTLTPMLTPAEERQLNNAKGWPTLAQTILELSDKHPVYPPLPSGEIKRFDQLPPKDRQALMPFKGRPVNPLMAKQEGRWPDFALAVTEHYPVSRPLGASKTSEFSQEIQDFIKDQLLPALTPFEAERLKNREGNWPGYPRMLHELAKKYNLVIPGMSLPGPAELWEAARVAAVPEVPDHMLRAFADELSPEEWRRLNLTPGDPWARDRLRGEFFRKNPGQLNRFGELDQRPPQVGKHH
jgi:hypothetical protein